MSRGEAPRSGPIAWMAANPVAANLLMLLCLVGGLIVGSRVTQEVFPNFDMEFVQIRIDYPGASPEEVESGIVVAVEDAVMELEPVIEVRSTATEGRAVVVAELDIDADVDRALRRIRDAVDRLQSIPKDAEPPRIAVVDREREVISLLVHGSVDLGVLADVSERVRAGLLSVAEISRVRVRGLRPREVAVEISQLELERIDMDVGRVAALVARSALDAPGGRLDTSGGGVLVRTAQARHGAAEFCDVELTAGGSGGRLRLCDVARVRDGFADGDAEIGFEDEPAVMLRVYRTGEHTPVEVVEAVRGVIEDIRPGLPAGVELSSWFDRSEMYRERMGLLLRNAAIGLVLVLVVLGLFIEARVAFWVTMGIPISFLGALLLMPGLGVTINMISMFGFIVTLGMVVDDAIVVGENVFRHRRDGVAPLEAAIRGAREVAVPVTFSILTTVVAFCPILWVPGFTGKLYRVIPTIVITVLCLSLIESLFVLPAHLAHVRSRATSADAGRLARLRAAFEASLDRLIHVHFRSWLDRCLHWRYAVIAIALALMTVLWGYAASGRVTTRYMPAVEGNRVNIQLRLANGVPVEHTRRVRDEVVGQLRRSLRRFEAGAARSDRGILSQIAMATTDDAALFGGDLGGHRLTVQVYLKKREARSFSTREFIEDARAALGRPRGVESLELDAIVGPAAGAAIDVELSHPEPDRLEQATRAVAGALRNYPGVQDIARGDAGRSAELQFRLRPLALDLQLRPADIASQVRAAIHGAEALRQQEGPDEVRVRVRLPARERNSQASLERLMIRTARGGRVPLAELVDMAETQSQPSIARANGRRIQHVTARVEAGRASPGAIRRSLAAHELAQLSRDDPQLEFRYSGTSREQSMTLAVIIPGAVVALLVIYALIAIPFRSYVQPIIVMLAIPFGAAGAVLGHIAMGYELSIISVLGIVALGGVVVNDSLVLIHAANAHSEAGPRAAILEAACRRFRPIVLTSLTTSIGLMPMILEPSVQAKFLVPMAISLAFGVLLATVVILVVVPAIYLAIEDLRGPVSRN